MKSTTIMSPYICAIYDESPVLKILDSSRKFNARDIICHKHNSL